MQISSNINDDDLYRHISIQIALGNALFDKARLTRKSEPTDEAISMFAEVKRKLSQIRKFEDLLAHASNSFAAALMTRSSLLDGDMNQIQSDEIIEAYREAVANAERCRSYEVWGVAQMNMGQALARRAEITTDNESAAFYRLRSISALLAAIETYPATEFPLPLAQAHLRLGGVLFRQGLTLSDQACEVYLIRAVNSYEMALSVIDEQNQTSDWTSIHAELGRIFFSHSKMADAEIAKSDLDRATQHVKNALKGYEALGSKAGIKGSAEALRSIEIEKGKHLSSNK
jgi:tetratricopeptide (TPR) repeat protein